MPPSEEPDRTWIKDGACWTGRAEHIEKFYPRNKSVIPALEMCHKCKVRAECFDYATETKQRFGIWGGVKFGNGE